MSNASDGAQHRKTRRRFPRLGGRNTGNRTIVRPTNGAASFTYENTLAYKPKCLFYMRIAECCVLGLKSLFRR